MIGLSTILTEGMLKKNQVITIWTKRSVKPFLTIGSPTNPGILQKIDWIKTKEILIAEHMFSYGYLEVVS